MEEARRQDLIYHHAMSVSTSSRGGGGPGACGNLRGKQCGPCGGGRSHGALRHLALWQGSAKPQADKPANSLVATDKPTNPACSGNAGRTPSTPPPARGHKGGGRGAEGGRENKM